jgi:hypothetical protein|tara:strand:+ start:373 stop:594 length:222 start_codon:yes stop_codon:yes gene_type:complete
VAAQKIGSIIAQLNSEKFGLIMSNIPRNPTNMAEILYRPTSFFKINLEKIVIKKGDMKKRLVASANGIRVNEI